MKPCCPTCEKMVGFIHEAIEDLDSDDPVERLAARLLLAMVASEDHEPTEDGRWSKTVYPF